MIAVIIRQLIGQLTADGVRHSSAIAKIDLTFVSSAICLSGRDRDLTCSP
jgi:hypothetical protein